MKLTPKQKAFADYYIELGNATEAYIKAGYNKKGARANSSRLIANDNIKNYIDERFSQLEDERIAKADEVLKYLTRVMRGEETEEVVVIEGMGDGVSRAAITEKDIGAKDRIKAAELLGKRYRLFTDKVEIEGEIPVVISGGDNLED